jgi:hypothetical protein
MDILTQTLAEGKLPLPALANKMYRAISVTVFALY